MYKVLLGIFLTFLATMLVLMMEVPSHGAAVNFCTYVAFYWSSCSKWLPVWFDDWAWLLPTFLAIAGVIFILWNRPAKFVAAAIAGVLLFVAGMGFQSWRTIGPVVVAPERPLDLLYEQRELRGRLLTFAVANVIQTTTALNQLVGSMTGAYEAKNPDNRELSIFFQDALNSKFATTLGPLIELTRKNIGLVSPDDYAEPLANYLASYRRAWLLLKPFVKASGIEPDSGLLKNWLEEDRQALRVFRELKASPFSKDLKLIEEDNFATSTGKFDDLLRSSPSEKPSSRSGASVDNQRLISELGIKRDGNNFVRDMSIVQNSVDHWEVFNDGIAMINFPNQVDPTTLVVREAGDASPLIIVERGSHKVRFRLSPSALSNGLAHIVIEGD